LQSGPTDLDNINSLPFQIAFRCLWANVINAKIQNLTSAGLTASWDFPVSSDPSFSVVEFIPELDFDRSCSSLDQEQGSLCSVDFAISKMIPPTANPSNSPTAIPTEKPTGKPSLSPTIEPSPARRALVDGLSTTVTLLPFLNVTTQPTKKPTAGGKVISIK
jgi:hypothetical protein